MSAHNPATLGYAVRRLEHVRNLLADLDKEAPGRYGRNPAALDWARTLNRAILQGHTPGTLRRFLQDNHLNDVETLQANLHLDDAEVSSVTGLWAPGPRTVDARTRKTSATLDGSTRDYAGVTTFLATDNLYVGYGSWGAHGVQLIVYRTVSDADPAIGRVD